MRLTQVLFGVDTSARLPRGGRDRRSVSISVAGRDRGLGLTPLSDIWPRALEILSSAQRWRPARAEPMGSDDAPGCLGNSQWAAGTVPSAAAPGWRRQEGQALVEVVETQVAGASPAERRSGPLEPRAGARRSSRKAEPRLAGSAGGRGPGECGRRGRDCG